jgi:uncharacterized protein YjbI with pentapeptide repeats
LIAIPQYALRFPFAGTQRHGNVFLLERRLHSSSPRELQREFRAFAKFDFGKIRRSTVFRLLIFRRDFLTRETDFREATLREAILRETDLRDREAIFREAILRDLRDLRDVGTILYFMNIKI